MTERRRRRRQEAPPELKPMDGSRQGSGLAPVTQEANAIARARRADIAEAESASSAPKVVTAREASLEAARRRTAEILEHDIGIGDEGEDKFHVPEHLIPDGWKYQWRRVSSYGKEDPQYQVKIAQTGWRPVPAERHPEMMPSSGGPYYTIDRDGMRLMEIPAEVHKLLAARDQRRAIEQVRIRTEQVKQTPNGHFPRDQHAKVAPQVKHGYEPLIVPEA